MDREIEPMSFENVSPSDFEPDPMEKSEVENKGNFPMKFTGGRVIELIKKGEARCVELKAECDKLQEEANEIRKEIWDAIYMDGDIPRSNQKNLQIDSDYITLGFIIVKEMKKGDGPPSFEDFLRGILGGGDD